MIKISKVAQCRLSITLRLNVTLTLYHASKIDSNQDPGSGSRSIEWLQYLKIFPDTESGSGYGSTPNVNQDTHQISVKSLCNIFELCWIFLAWKYFWFKNSTWALLTSVVMIHCCLFVVQFASHWLITDLSSQATQNKMAPVWAVSRGNMVFHDTMPV